MDQLHTVVEDLHAMIPLHSAMARRIMVLRIMGMNLKTGVMIIARITVHHEAQAGKTEVGDLHPCHARK